MYNKINRIKMYPALIVIFFLQATLLDLIKAFNIKPDLGASFVIFIGIFFGWGPGLEAGFVFGLLKDIYSVDIFGANAFAMALAGLAAAFLSPKLFRESRATYFFIVFVLTLFYFFMHYLISSAISDFTHTSLSEYLFSFFIPVSLYTAFVSFFAFPFLIDRFGLKEDAEYL